MSSDPPPSGRSPAAEDSTRVAASPGDASLVRVRGETLLDALGARIPGARRHADGTAAYAFAAAVELELDRPSCELIRETGRLHDIGQLYVRAALLARPAAGLSARDHASLEAHAEAGARLGLGAGLPGLVCEWLLCSRERFDGLGRPAGLAGERVPMASRIIRAACAYDGVLGEGLGATQRRAALARLQEAAGVELDPRVVDALATLVERAARAAEET
jgi:HD-GYP domain-containing protein (c-di-GMP phosphodiesterase class II)